MPQEHRCPDCQRVIPEGSPDGQCPFCRMNLGPVSLHQDSGSRLDGRDGQVESNGADDAVSVSRDRNLLFGVLAVQIRLISSRQFLEAASAWATDPKVGLGSRLVNLGAMSETDCQLVDDLVARAVAHHNGDEGAALTHLRVEEDIAEQLTEFDSERRQEIGRQLGITTDDGTIDDAIELGIEGPRLDEAPGRYSRRKEYRRGGMGRILLVHDEFLSRDVALKELLPRPKKERSDSDSESPVRASSALVARFLREAKVTGQLEHPSIVPVYELGRRADGGVYYTMKLVRGQTFAKALHSTSSLRERLTYISHFLDLCQALAYAHSRGVIHRDIKPSNVMIGEFGETVLIDWGLAKVVGDPEETLPQEVRTRVLGEFGSNPSSTLPGALIGTPQYMSPEQAEGRIEDIDERSDVFALGVVLYQILTGSRPFDGGSSKEVVDRVKSATPRSAAQVEPNAPAELVSICERAMRKAAVERYQSARELASDIERFINGALVEAYEYTPIELAKRVYKRNRAAANTALAATLLLACFGAYSYLNIMRSRNEALVAADRESIARQAEKLARNRAEAVSYINQIRLADSYLQQRNSGTAIDVLWETAPERRNWEWGYLLNKAHPELYSITGDGFAISNDGAWIAAQSRFKPVNIFDARDGSLVRSLPSAQAGIVFQSQFSSDDKLLLMLADWSRVLLFDTQRWESRQTIAPGGTVNSAKFLANDRVLISQEQGTVTIWKTDGTLEKSFPCEAPVGFTTASSDGARVMARGGTNSIQVWDSETDQQLCLIRTDQAPERLAFSPNGELVAFSVGNTIEVWSVDESESVAKFSDPQQKMVTSLAFDSTGSRLMASDANATLVWPINDADSRLVRISTGANVSSAMWSPDDSLICTIRFNEPSRVWDSRSGRLVKELGDHSLPIRAATFLPRSSKILTSSIDQTIKVWPASTTFGQEVVGRTRNPISSVSASRDIDRLAIQQSNRVLSVSDPGRDFPGTEVAVDGASDLMQISPDGRFVVITVDAFRPAVFSAGTNELLSANQAHEAYIKALTISPDSGRVASAGWDGTVLVWDPDTGKTFDTIRHPNEPGSIAFTPDGKGLVVGDVMGSLTVYELETGVIAQQIDAGEGGISTLDWSIRTRQLASGTSSNAVIVWGWNGLRLERQFVLAGDGSNLSSVCWLASHDRIVTCSSFNTRIWDSRNGDLIVALADPLELSRSTRQIGGQPDQSANLISTTSTQLSRWSPAPWQMISESDDPRSAFSQYRIDAISRQSQRYPIAQSKVQLVVTSAEILNRALVRLRDAIRNEDFESATNAQMSLVIDSEIFDAALKAIALQARDTILSPRHVESALNALKADPKQLQLELVRDNRPKTLTYLIEPIESETIRVTLARAVVADVFGRLQSVLELTDGPANSALFGFRLPPPAGGTNAASDRSRFSDSQLTPFDEIVAINEQPIETTSRLSDALGSLLKAIESGATASLSIDVRRGKFRKVHVEYQIQ